MPTIAAWLRVDGDCINEDLHEAVGKLEQADGEMVLDFSSVRRIDTSAVRELQRLAEAAEEKAVKLSLHSLDVDVYKVLKLVKLTRRFSLDH